MKINGKPVKDAKRSIYVDITPADIKAGAKRNAKSCAAAISLVRNGQCEEALVRRRRIYLKKNGSWIRYYTPDALYSEVVAFDRGGDFQSGTYKLTPLSPSQQPGSRPERANYRSGGHDPNAKKRIAHIRAGVRERMSDFTHK